MFCRAQRPREVEALEINVVDSLNEVRAYVAQ
jgi:hypothetical protein